MSHPMTPPPEQFGEWLADACKLHPCGKPGLIAGRVAELAYAAGADAELEACWEWITGDWDYTAFPGAQLRAARRPAPTPQQQALNACAAALAAGRLTPSEACIIRLALEAQP